MSNVYIAIQLMSRTVKSKQNTKMVLHVHISYVKDKVCIAVRCGFVVVVLVDIYYIEIVAWPYFSQPRFKQKRNATHCNNSNGLLQLSFIWKISLFLGVYLEPSRTSLMQVFWENSQRLLAVNYFRKEAWSHILAWFLNTPLILILKLQFL